MTGEPAPDEKDKQADYEPPAGAEMAATWTAGTESIEYTASAGWIVLRKKEKPAAEIFSVSYVADTDQDRPVMFVFNGGPGSSSAYLHMGAAGPSRVAFPADGTLPQSPPRLVPNAESWLAFTDLVFVDPVGTGFSRVIDKQRRDGESDKQGASNAGDQQAREFFGYKRDLESLCEFMGRWLSGNRRWGSPVFIVGESYGGYRVGRLVRMLQETTGIALNGAVMLSPALEFASLAPTDYDVLGWVDLVPTMALAAVYHGRSRVFAAGTAVDDVAREAEAFATGEFALLLTRGASMPPEERERVLGRLADLIGLPVELVVRAEGRITLEVFARELLRDERRVVGYYDATITASDPFPDREPFAGPDPTLAGIAPAYATAINRQLRSEIGVQTDREYVVLSYEVNESWRNDAIEHFFLPPVGATDDFRYGMALNPYMQALIAHGLYDMVTPYHASDRLRNLMRLDAEMAGRLTVRRFGGGHMFYTWEESRREFAATIAAFVTGAVASA